MSGSFNTALSVFKKYGRVGRGGLELHVEESTGSVCVCRMYLQSVEKFRTTSLLNVERKLFFALKSEQIIGYDLANGYMT